MPISPYIKQLRNAVGHSLLLLPGVTAVIRDHDRLLLARQADTGVWSLIGGGVEPGEEPQAALIREVTEELGLAPTELQIIGAYAGPELISTYPNGDQVGYVTTAYRCQLPDVELRLDQDEVLEVGWFRPAEVNDLPRHHWIDRVIADAKVLPP